MAPPRFALLGVAVAGLTTAAVRTGGGGAAGWPLHLGLWLTAGLAWVAALAALGRIAPRASDGAVLVAVAIAVRAAAWLAPPLHSDDVYRYAWDGRVASAGVNPYAHAPADPALSALRDGAPATPPDTSDGERRPPRPPAGAGVFPRINNPDLPTIYPPAAQLLFRAAASLPLPPVAALKLLVGACDLTVLALLGRWLRRRGGIDPRWAAAWGWSPLVAIEAGQEAHVDPLAIVGLTAALLAWEQGRRLGAGAWLGLSVAAKLIALPTLVGMRSSRALAAAAAVVALLALPYLGAGPALLGSSGEFARRWRGNEGAFAVIAAGAEPLACALIERLEPAAIAGGTAACARPLDLAERPWLAALLTGRDRRTTVFPDELAGALARAAVGLLLAALLAWLAWRRATPLQAAEWTLGALLLLTPALKPWYVLWLLPLAAVTRRPAWLALATLAPLGYLPLASWLEGAPWHDPAWARALQHGACWLLLVVGAALGRRAGPSTGAGPVQAATVPKLDPPAAPATIPPR